MWNFHKPTILMKALEHIQSIGDMNEIFDILKPVSSFNDYGEEIINYVKVHKIFGAFSFRLTGTESTDTDQVVAHHTAEITTRYITGINEKWRVVRRADMTDWNISRITDNGRFRYMILTITKAT